MRRMRDDHRTASQDLNNARGRIRLPWAMLLALVVFFSMYLNVLGSQSIAINGATIYSHPDVSLFIPARLNLKLSQVVMFALLAASASFATVVVCNWWWTGRYRLRTLLAHVFVVSVLLFMATSFKNALVSGSISKNIVSIPMWFGFSNLLLLLCSWTGTFMTLPRPNWRTRRF